MSIMRRIGGAIQAAAGRHPEMGRALATLKQSGATGRRDRPSAEPAATGTGGGLGGALALGGLVLGAAAAAAVAAGGDAGEPAPSSGGGADQFLADRCASMIDGLDTTWGGQ